jgi:CRISPR/Cas system CSM-associated protein Csm3 (group 7 of RAMP superfamily)
MLKCTLEALGSLISIDQRNSRLYQLIGNNGKPLKFTSGAKRGDLCKVNCFKFLRNSRGQIFLQGTSLKGMIRSVYETITNSCLTLAAISRTGYKNIGEHKNTECKDMYKLCPACRLFGIINDELHCQGRIMFTDALLVKGNLTSEPPISNQSPNGKPFYFLKVLSSPQPRHHPTYGKKGQRNGPIAGRKFYYHHGKDTKFFVNEHEARRSIAIEEYAPVKTRFGFEVYVENLDKDEFEYLVLALELYEGLGHKIGLGKAIGLGSCCITIDRDQSFIAKGSDRYQDWNSTKDTTWYSLKKDKEKLPSALIEVLRLNKEDDDGKIGYPADFNNYPNDPIDARGVFGGNSTEGGRPRWPNDVATEPPKVSQDHEAVWLNEDQKQALIEEKRKQEELLLQKEQDRDRQLREKQQEEEIGKAKEQRAVELKAMTPEQRVLAELGDPSILENRAVEIYNKIDEFSEENKRALAMALKKYWEACGKWKKKNCSKKQRIKVQKIKEIFEES